MVWRMSSAATRSMAAKEASAKTAAGVVLRETTGAGLERGIVSDGRFLLAPKGRAAAAGLLKSRAALLPSVLQHFSIILG